MSGNGLCQYCGAEIGTDSWQSCPECGEIFDDDQCDDDDDDNEDDDE